jgi:hypothetical protein
MQPSANDVLGDRAPIQSLLTPQIDRRTVLATAVPPKRLDPIQAELYQRLQAYELDLLGNSG